MFKVSLLYVPIFSLTCLMSCSTQLRHSDEISEAISTIELNLHRKDFNGKRVSLNGYIFKFEEHSGHFLLINSEPDRTKSGKLVNGCLGKIGTDIYFYEANFFTRLRGLNHRHVVVSGIFVDIPVEVYRGITYVYSGELKDIKFEKVYDDYCDLMPLTHL